MASDVDHFCSCSSLTLVTLSKDPTGQFFLHRVHLISCVLLANQHVSNTSNIIENHIFLRHLYTFKTINQSINQSINQPINQSINQSIKQSIMDNMLMYGMYDALLSSRLCHVSIFFSTFKITMHLAPCFYLESFST